MPATFNIPTQQVIPGQLIASALWNNEFKNIFDNFAPGGVDDYSSTSTQMQTMTDPFPGSILSLPVSLAGELERIRFVLAAIKGVSNWTDPAPRTLVGLDSFALNHAHTGGADGTKIGSGGIVDGAISTVHILNATVTQAKMAAGVVLDHGTIMVFYQGAAPVGWTQVTTQHDKVIRVVSTSGGNPGGFTPFSSAFNLQHNHRVNSHDHSIAHQHLLPLGINGAQIFFPPNPVYTPGGTAWPYGQVNLTSLNFWVQGVAGIGSGAGGLSWFYSGPSTAGNSGASSPDTNDALTNAIPQYVDVIICQKD